MHTIAVAGKGGVGKTTVCGMLIDLHRYLFPDSSYYVECTGYFKDLYKLRRLNGQIEF